jgi:hypothetical protein
VAFGGFYAASKRARIAIASSFLLTFLTMLTFVLTIGEFALATRGAGEALVSDFRAVVITVVGSYFGSEAVVSAVKIVNVRRAGATPAEIRRADRDLASTPRSSR